jgi:hypothetical protein
VLSLDAMACEFMISLFEALAKLRLANKRLIKVMIAIFCFFYIGISPLFF